MAPHTLIVKTPRLLLRDWSPDDPTDVQAIFRIRSDPRGLAHVSSLPPANLTECHDFMREEQSRDAYFGFVVKLVNSPPQPLPNPFSQEQQKTSPATDGKIIGFVGGFPAPTFGYVFDSNYWGHGYATEAARACFDAHWTATSIGALSLAGLVEDDRERIVLKILSENRASVAVAEKLGAHRIGTEIKGKEQSDGTKTLVPWEVYELRRPARLAS